MCQEGTSGTRNLDVKEQLRLGNERTTRGIYRKSTGLEIAKQIARLTVGLKRIEDWTLWRGRPPPKRKKKPCCYRRSRYCRSTGSQRQKERKDFIGCRLGRAHIRRERWQWLENDHCNPEKETDNKRKHRAQKKKTLQA
jgi:hypothetical protein